MADFSFGKQGEHFRDYRPVGERLESNRPHEFGSRLGHDDINQGPGLYQPAGQLGSFISGNAAGYAHDDVFVLK